MQAQEMKKRDKIFFPICLFQSATHIHLLFYKCTKILAGIDRTSKINSDCWIQSPECLSLVSAQRKLAPQIL